MRDLERKYRITARSIPEVIGEMESVLSRYGMSRKMTFRGRKLSNEAFINAAILYVLGLPAKDQEAALGAALKNLESILAGPDAAGESGEDDAAADADAAPPAKTKVIRTPRSGGNKSAG